MTRRFGVLVLVAGLSPSLAIAHTGIGGTSGFAAGFAHPISGLDHVLAMVLVGVLASAQGGRALWAIPAAFLAAMAAGGVIGVAGFALPFVQAVIAASVLVLGAALALGLRPPLAFGALAVAVFAILHGHAHGAEIPEAAGGLRYALGFVTATGLLHLAGLAFGMALERTSARHAPFALRSAGALSAVAGLGLLVRTL